MSLDSFNKRKLSRRDFLGVIAATPVLKLAGANATSSGEVPAALVQNDAMSGLESVTEQEVCSVLGDLLGNIKYKEIRKLTDKNGLYLFDVEIPQEDGRIEYSYRRGRPEKKELHGWRIDKTIYDATGMPISGHSVAKKTGGIWRLTPK